MQSSECPRHGCRRSSRGQQGFSLIEVLVTMLIISLALLGTVGMQAYAMRLGKGAEFRTRAVVLAADLAERMEANRAVATAATSPTEYEVTAADWATYRANASSISAACTAAQCAGGALADYDLSQWESAVANAANLPQGSATVERTLNIATGASVYTITIGWTDRRDDPSGIRASAPSASSAVGVNAAGTGERFFYTATRTIFP